MQTGEGEGGCSGMSSRGGRGFGIGTTLCMGILRSEARSHFQGGGEIEVRNFSQFSAISQFFAIFRNFSQFSAIFRNFSAIFLTSRFSDCLPTLVQNSEKKKFFTMPFTL